MFRFFGFVLLLALAFCVGVFAERDFAVVDVVRQELGQAPTPSVGHRCTCGCEKTGQCTCPNCSVGCGFLPVPRCQCKGKCDCCPACPGKGGSGKCTCQPVCKCCPDCPGHKQ